jgi:DNA-binding CsgD family transcriptional regulator
LTGRWFPRHNCAMALQRFVFQNFTARELKIIEMRTNGASAREIAKEVGAKNHKIIHYSLWRIYKKVGTSNLALLTRWAIENALDVPALPDTEENEVVLEPKKRRHRIRLGRIRRARMH